VTAILDDYVTGNAAHTIEARERLRASSRDPSLFTEARAFGEALIATGKFPQLEALTEHARTTGGQTGPLAHLDRQFEIGLAALLDGVQQHYGIS
jgi:hypothetical protein